MSITLLLIVVAGLLALAVAALWLGLRRVTHRLRHESDERALLETILESVPGMLYLFDKDGKYLRWNRSFLSVSGYSADELSQLNPLDFVSPEDLDAVSERIAEVMERGEAQVEAQLLSKDGRLTPHLFTGRRLIYRNQPVIAGMGIDISDRARIEHQLRESEEQFKQLTETIEEIFWISDPGVQRALYASPAFERTWGFPFAELQKDPERWLASVHPEDRDTVVRALPEQVTGNYDINYRIIRPDGTVRWIRDRAYPVRNAAGVAYRLVGIAEDITERRAIEAQFFRAQRMESIGTLAGGVAHDLNNVLTPILMSVELLRGEQDPMEQNEILDTVEATARKGAAMVRHLLHFARGIDGQRVRIELRDLIDDVVRIGNDTFLKSIQLVRVVESDLPPIVGDPTQLHQVLLNLVVNARDAMPHGGVITLSARREDLHHPDSDLLIEVSDTGTGIPSDLLERIFEPFFTTKPQGKGTGLGLSTSHAIVVAHGGVLRARSEVGKGSTFTIRLPVLAAPAPKTAAPIPRHARHGTSELFLVVDDEAAIRAATSRLLQSLGYRIMLASNGREAVEYFAAHQHQIAVVLTDMMMPVMDGATAIARIRAIDPGVRIITTSGLADRSNLPDPLPGERHIPHLAKPYSSHELLAAIDEVFAEP